MCASSLSESSVLVRKGHFMEHCVGASYMGAVLQDKFAEVEWVPKALMNLERWKCHGHVFFSECDVLRSHIISVIAVFYFLPNFFIVKYIA